MRKLRVVLSFVEGDFRQGIRTQLQLGTATKFPLFQTPGNLSPAPEILDCLHKWRSTHRTLARHSQPRRIKAAVAQQKNAFIGNLASALRNSLNSSLNSESFRPSRETLLSVATPNDEIQLFIQSGDIVNWQLPWNLWDFCDRFPNSEIALCAPTFEPVASPKTWTGIRILAILGDDSNIDVNTDREIIEGFPNVKVKFLVQPNREEINNQLWEHPWDILFYAGHTGTSNGTGKIYINHQDSLTVSDLKCALKNAIRRGLQLAIFNSCDGLGLAKDLADLHIPQTIVMREPVPDRVAQEFLKYFLQAFSGGKSLYLSVREARERLQGWEYRFPCASWLPVLVQNPAVKSPTWNSLAG